jgi:hypothetical protein
MQSLYQDFTTKMSRNIKDLPSICLNAEPRWSEFFHMPNEKCHGQVGWMHRLVGGEESRPYNHIFISRKPRRVGGELHSLEREHGTIGRSGFSSGHNNALTIEEGDASATPRQILRDSLRGKQKEGGD